MFNSFALTPDSFISSDKSFAAYSRQQHLLNPSRVHEGFLIRIGSLEAMEWKEVSFAGIPFDFRIMSIWVWSDPSTTNDSLDVEIKYEGDTQVWFNLSAGDVPWEPPFNILGSGHTLRIRADAGAGGMSLFLQPAKLLDVEGA